MSKFKKVTAIVLCIAIIFVLGGCKQEEKAQECVNLYFSAVASAGKTQPNQYLVNPEEQNALDEQRKILFDDEIMNTLNKNLRYEILDKEKKDRDTVEMKIAIDTIDMKILLPEYLSYAIKLGMLSGLNGEYTESMIEKKLHDFMIKSMENENAQRIRNEVKIKVIKSQGEWKINMDEKLYDAITGGMVTALKNMKDTMEKNSVS